MAEIAPDILARAQGGETAAFDELVRFYRQDLLRVTYRFVGNYEDARDVLQLVFIKVYQNIGSWLYRIAVNESLGWKKREKRRYGVVTPIEETPYPDAPSGTASPLDDVAREEIGERLIAAIDMLPEMQRATFVLRYREELSVKETAAVLGCAEGTVKANGFHAIRRLRQILRTEDPEVIPNESSAL